MYRILKPVLFKTFKDPETAHNMALSFLRFAGTRPIKPLVKLFTKVESESLRQRLWNLNFKNPVGLAGGFDKHGTAIAGLSALGFGFLEIGTVTKHGQPGNPRPRIFRLEQDLALINRMGFNNFGADSLAQNLAGQKPANIPIGISLGKSKITELGRAAEDYLYSFQKLYNYGDYFVVNVSSPNTPNLRRLQDKNFLEEIISGLKNFAKTQKLNKPILIKITSDLSLDAVDEVLEVCKNYLVDGIIATNTSLGREGLKVKTNEAGGLSGLPIKNKAAQLIKYIYKHAKDLPVIGVGGIFTAEDAYEKIKAGATLVQIYTGFVYQGPLVVKKINLGLVKLFKRDGLKNINEAVGVECR